LPTSATTTGRPRAGRKLLAALLLTSAVGCGHRGYTHQEAFAERVLPPAEISIIREEAPPPQEPARETTGGARAPVERPQSPKGPDGKAAPLPAEVQGGGAGRAPARPLTLLLTLPDAIALAFQQQPRLRASLESIEQARGREDIAFAAFLPALTTGYSAGGFNLNAGGEQVSVGQLPGFTFIPALGAIPVGLNIKTGYELAELKLQWLVCDFGRRMGRYNQAGLAADIAQLQTLRAYQTVANDVAVAYYQVLRARSLHRIARESVRRAEDDLDVERKLEKRGVVEREKVLRAEVGLAQAQRALDVAEEAEAVAVAALNLAIGLNVSAPTGVVDTAEAPPFTLSLADCLQAAVGGRRELQVARQSVQAAQEGSRVARADFAPRIVAEGYLNDFQQSNPRGHANLALGLIKLEWGVFEGGKRVAELRVADSRIREALAQAESIADTIAFQVNQAYRQMIAARKGIDRSRPAVDQARETYRLVVARSRRGDATPAELTEAQAGLTRAEQDYANSLYDYLTALERLQYAMGTTATPLTPAAHP
jgi:outer membrane protein